MNKITDLLQELKEQTLAQDTPQAFVSLCNALYGLKQYFVKEVTYLCPDTEIRYKFDDLMLEYGLDKTQTSRFLSAHEKYFEDNKLRAVYENFTKWKLFYLLAVPSSVLEPDLKNSRISAYSTVKEIRKYVSLNKVKKDNAKIGGAADDEFSEDDIPEVYDPKQSYAFDYFEEKTKAQLLNIVWELQKFAHKKK